MVSHAKLADHRARACEVKSYLRLFWGLFFDVKRVRKKAALQWAVFVNETAAIFPVRTYFLFVRINNINEPLSLGRHFPQTHMMRKAEVILRCGQAQSNEICTAILIYGAGHTGVFGIHDFDGRITSPCLF